jgi:carboxylesterase 2
LNAEGLAVTGYNTSGKYGVLGHLEVLKWVQENIANFGGDPDRTPTQDLFRINTDSMFTI